MFRVIRADYHDVQTFIPHRPAKLYRAGVANMSARMIHMAKEKMGTSSTNTSQRFSTCGSRPRRARLMIYRGAGWDLQKFVNTFVSVSIYTAMKSTYILLQC